MVQTQWGQVQGKQKIWGISQSHSIFFVQNKLYLLTTPIFGEYISKLLDIEEAQGQAPVEAVDYFSWSSYTSNIKKS